MNGPLLRFLVLLFAGFLGAAATGKLVPHARWLTDTYGITLGMAGFAISAVMLPGAVLSFGLGHFADRFGARSVTVTGLVASAVASSLLGAAATFPILIALRLIEGLGYCLLVVAATMLVVETSTDRRRTLALSVWSSFAPIGFALGQWASASVSGDDRLWGIGLWHGVMLAIAAVVVLAVFPSSVLRSAGGRPAATGSIGDSLRHQPALRSALAFGCVTGVLLAAVAVTPLVLARTHGISVAEAARLAALASLPGIAGRFAAGWLLGLGLTPAAILITSGLAGTAAIALALTAELPLAGSLALFTLFQMAMGTIPGVMSAMIPLVAPARDRIGSVSGLVNQMVTLGNLVGPPLVLTVFAIAGAEGAAVLLAATAALSVALVVRLAVFKRAVARA